MKYLYIIFALGIISCNRSNNDIELEIVTKSVNALNIKPTEYGAYYENTGPNVKDAQTILTYKLTNNSNKTYYFNLDSYNLDLYNNYIKMDKAFVKIFDSQNNEIKIKGRSASAGFDTSKDLYLKYLHYNYPDVLNSKNFFIHPHETLYFEWFIVLPFGNLLEDTNYSVVLDAQKKYFAEILISSNGINYKKEISRTDLKTIQHNGYEVYNGVIKSKNKVPIVFMNVSSK